MNVLHDCINFIINIKKETQTRNHRKCKNETLLIKHLLGDSTVIVIMIWGIESNFCVFFLHPPTNNDQNIIYGGDDDGGVQKTQSG